jgi:hypothetical protein
MDKSSVQAIVEALNHRQVQYLIVGGLAVVAHGYVRLTADVDLMLAIDGPNLSRAVAAMKSLDYRPRAPVAIEDFLSADLRGQWATQKNMVVFALYSPRYPGTEVDFFLEPPIDFGPAYAAAVRLEVAPGTLATFCGVDDLIRMKTKAGRPRDLEDIRQLRRLKPGEHS